MDALRVVVQILSITNFYPCQDDLRTIQKRGSIAHKRQILTVIILLHNFRTDVVGLNQIATVFNVEYESYLNIRNYDRIAQYYENVEDSDED